MRALGISLVGIGGFGRSYLDSIRYAEARGLCELKAVVVRRPERYPERVAELRREGIAIYAALSELLAQERGRDRSSLVAIPTGIDQHAPLSIETLSAGFDVLCVKPLAGNVAEAREMLRAQERSGRTLAVGYQDIFSPTVQELKRIAVDRELGALRSARGCVLWPRSYAYYGRNEWAGKIESGGRKLFDSPIQNAAAHYLNQMLYVAGPSRHESLTPQAVYAENYRAKSIESADTQYIRVTGDDDVVITLLASHAVAEFSGPVIQYDFENGHAIWHREVDGVSGPTEIFRYDRSGNAVRERSLDNGEVSTKDRVFTSVLTDLERRESPLCTVRNAIQHTVCVERAFESSGGVHSVGPEFTDAFETESRATDSVAAGRPTRHEVIVGFEDAAGTLFKRGIGPAEGGLPWARSGTEISVAVVGIS